MRKLSASSCPPPWQVVTEPLAVPAPDQPLKRVDRFSRLWCSHKATLDGPCGSYSAAGAGGVDCVASDKGVTVWRPQPPVGYAILGDVLSAGVLTTACLSICNASAVEHDVMHIVRDFCSCCIACCDGNPHSCPQIDGQPLTLDCLHTSFPMLAPSQCCAPGHSQPEHQVVAVAINSGLVTYPSGYTLAWQAAGVNMWRPMPPPGYVALGCLAVPSEGDAEPPPRQACVVLAMQVAVDALLAECMLLSTCGNLWCVQNSCGTFEVAPPDSHRPQVRNPAVLSHLFLLSCLVLHLTSPPPALSVAMLFVWLNSCITWWCVN